MKKNYVDNEEVLVETIVDEQGQPYTQVEEVNESDVYAYHKRAGYNLSWQAVFAGLVTYLASFLVLSLIGSAIGFGMTNLTARHPFEGVGIGLVIWFLIQTVLSLGLAGYVAGLTANRAGFVHGFLTWATSVVVMFLLLTNVIGSALGFAGQVAGTAAETAANTAGTLVEGVGQLSEAAFEQLTSDMHVDTEDLKGKVEEFLKDTDIPELQPEYLQGEVDATVEDLKQAGYDIVVEGQDPQKVFERVQKALEERTNQLEDTLDHDAVVKAVAKNTDLSEKEVDEAAQNIEDAYAEAVKQTKTMLKDADQKFQELKGQVEDKVDEVKEVADEVTDHTAQYSLLLFAGLLVGLFVTAYSGHAGSQATNRFY